MPGSAPTAGRPSPKDGQEDTSHRHRVGSPGWHSKASAGAQACRRQPALFKAELVVVCLTAFRLMTAAASSGHTEGLCTFAQEIWSVKLWY